MLPKGDYSKSFRKSSFLSSSGFEFEGAVFVSFTPRGSMGEGVPPVLVSVGVGVGAAGVGSGAGAAGVAATAGASEGGDSSPPRK